MRGRKLKTRTWRDLEKSVAKLLKALNIPYRRVSNYRCFKCGTIQNSSAAGLPDFILLKPFAFVECKCGKGKLSKGQSEVKGYAESEGVFWITCYDTTDALIAFLRLRGRIR